MMNRIYKSIFNACTGAWVAASEVTASRGKRSRSVVAVAVAGLLGAVVPHAQAQITAGPTGQCVVKTTNNVNVFESSTQSNDCAQLMADVLNGGALHDYSVNSTSPSTDTNYLNKGATGANALAAGVSAKAGADNAVAVGNGANASVSVGDVALGSGSVTAAPVATASTIINGTTYNFKGISPQSVVSVGSAGNERQVTNVAAGQIAAASTDAINGSQLYATNQALSTITANQTHYYSVNDGGTQKGNYLNDGAATAGDLAAGVDTKAKGGNAVAVGAAAKAKTGGSIAIGENATAGRDDMVPPALPTDTNLPDYQTRVAKRNNIAIGSGATADGGRVISIGQSAGAYTADNWNIYNINIGANAGASAYGRDNVMLGRNAGGDISVGQNTTITGPVNGSSGLSNVYIGTNVATGAGRTGQNIVDSTTGQLIPNNIINSANNQRGTTNNVVIGDTAGTNLSNSSNSNVLIGQFAGDNLKSIAATAVPIIPGFLYTYYKADGSLANPASPVVLGINTGVGGNALDGATGEMNSAYGWKSGQQMYGSDNAAYGYRTLQMSRGDLNVGVGAAAGYQNQSSRAISIGNSAMGRGDGSVAVGDNAMAGIDDHTNSGTPTAHNTTIINDIAIGTGARANGGNSIAMGAPMVVGTNNPPTFQATQATGESSIAIGNGAQALGKKSISIGTGNIVNAERSGAIGDPSTINAVDSYSVGNNNALAQGQTDVFALGNNINTTATNSVFLGSNAAFVANGYTANTLSVPTTAIGSTAGLGTYTQGTVNGVTYGAFAGSAPVGVVSVGGVGSERRIQNVAAGLISAASTDAINGSQLYVLWDYVTKGWNLGTGTTTGTGGTTTGGSTGGTGGTGTTTGTTTPVAVRPGDSVNLVAGTNINLDKSTVTNSESGTTTTTVTIATQPKLVADSLTINNGGPVISNTGINMNTQTITNLAPGVNGTDAVNVNQLTQTTTNLTAAGLNFAGNSGTTVHRDLGQTLTISGDATTAGTYSGNNIKTVTDLASGTIRLQMADSPQFTSVTTTGGITSGGTINANGGLTVGAGQTVDMGGNTINNVAPGAVSPTSTQAVNGSQLYQTNQAVTNLGNQINTVAKDAYAGVASAIASSSIPQVTIPGKSGFGMGAGTYHGQSSLAVGVSTMSDNGKWIFKGTLSSTTNGNVGAGIGGLYQW